MNIARPTPKAAHSRTGNKTLERVIESSAKRALDQLPQSISAMSNGLLKHFINLLEKVFSFVTRKIFRKFVYCKADDRSEFRR
jgi:hypothetical protein